MVWTFAFAGDHVLCVDRHIDFMIAQKYVIIATLVIWALATIPQTAVAVAFSVVMNAWRDLRAV